MKYDAASQIRRARGTWFTICEACLAYRAGKSAWKKKSFDRKCNTKFLSLRASFSR
jgi:hypothetical protein